MGIEPTRPAWKAGILPLNYTRACGDFQNCLTIIPHSSHLVNSKNKKIFENKISSYMLNGKIKKVISFIKDDILEMKVVYSTDSDDSEVLI